MVGRSKDHDFGNFIPTKHDSRTRLYQLERMSTVDPLCTADCIMLDGACECRDLSECKYIKPDAD